MISKTLPRDYRSWTEYNTYLEDFFRNLREKLSRDIKYEDSSLSTRIKLETHRRKTHLGIYLDD